MKNMERNTLIKLIVTCVVVVGLSILLSGWLTGGHIMYP